LTVGAGTRPEDGADGPESRTCFISYARQDRDFVARLVAALKERGVEPWFDGRIEGGTMWSGEIRREIDRRDAFVSILSPDFARSVECRNELSRAVDVNKVIVPVVARAVEADDLPDELRSRHWIPRAGLPADGSPPDLDMVCSEIERVLARNPARVVEHTRLTLRAADWEAGGRKRSALLRGRELRGWEQWLRRPGEPAAGPLQREYVAASRRGMRLRWAGLTVAGALGLAAAYMAVHQYGEARRRASEEQSQHLAGIANGVATRDVKRAERIALRAVERARTPEAEDALRRAVASDRLRWSGRGASGIAAADWRRAGSGPPMIVAADARGRVVLLRPATGRVLARFSAAATGPPRAVLWADRGRRIVVAGASTAFMWDVARPAAPPTRLGGDAASVLVSGDGSRLLLSDRFGRLEVRDAHSGRIVGRRTVKPPPDASVAISENGSTVAWTDPRADLHRWGHPVRAWVPTSGRRSTLAGRVDVLLGYTRLASARPQLTGCGKDGLRVWGPGRRNARRVAPGTLCFAIEPRHLSPSGRSFAVVREDGVIDMIERQGPAPYLYAQQITTDATLLGDVDISDPDPRSSPGLVTARLAVAGADGSVWLYTQGAAKQRLALFKTGVTALAWSPTQDMLLAVDGSGRAWLWDLRPRRHVPDETEQLVMSRDRRLVATAANGRIRLRDVRTLRPLASIRSQEIPVAFLGSGRDLLTVRPQPPLRQFSASPSTRLSVIRADGERQSLGAYDSYTVARDRPVVVGVRPGRAWLLDLSGAHIRRRALPRQDWMASMRLGPGGHRLALLHEGFESSQATLLDLGTGRRRRLPDAAEVAFSPSGRLLAVVGRDQHSVRVLDLATGQIVRRFGDLPPVDEVTWSPDGRSLLSIGTLMGVKGGTFTGLRLDGSAERTFDGSGSHNQPRYSPDGRLVIASRAGPAPGVDVWDADTGALVASWSHAGVVGADAVITPDGRGVLSLGSAGFPHETLDLLPCPACGSLPAVVAAARRLSAGR